jgi:hypothetical protein
MTDRLSTATNQRFLCLEEYEDGGNRCDVQCLGCTNVEEREANGKPPVDTARSERGATQEEKEHLQRQIGYLAARISLDTGGEIPAIIEDAADKTK